MISKRLTLQIYLFSILVSISLLSCNRVKKKAGEKIDQLKSLVNETEESIKETFNPTTKQLFENRTGLKITDSIYNITEKDTYFPHEGELSIVFNTTQPQIENWIKQSPPWDNPVWNTGKVPAYILNCNFGLDGGVSKSIFSYKDGTTDTVYQGDSVLINLINNDNNAWVSKEYCCEDDSLFRYHDGQLLIIEKDKNKVWYSNWNY